ncbi:MAG: cation:proton antiporter, partial [Leifsonia sp.]|nr:cation:proton antiporter [Leifsonia sp.]
MDAHVSTIVLVPLLAVGAALLTTAVGRFAKIPLVVFEIVLGLLLGPSVLGWIPETDALDMVANFGLAFLFFMAGNEIDFAAIGARHLRRASLSWVLSLVLAVVLATLIAGELIRGVYIGIALTSTALGTLMPVLRDAGELRTPFGRALTAVGAVGEFGPLLAISLFLSGRKPLAAALVLIGFAIIAGGAIWFASRGVH